MLASIINFEKRNFVENEGRRPSSDLVRKQEREGKVHYVTRQRPLPIGGNEKFSLSGWVWFVGSPLGTQRKSVLKAKGVGQELSVTNS